MITQKVIRLPMVKELTGLSTSSIWRAEHSGTFPRRITLGARAVGWQYQEVMKWVESRVHKV